MPLDANGEATLVVKHTYPALYTTNVCRGETGRFS